MDFARIAKKIEQDCGTRFPPEQVEAMFAHMHAADYPDPVGDEVLVDLEAAYGLTRMVAMKVRGKWLLTLSPKGLDLLTSQLARVALVLLLCLLPASLVAQQADTVTTTTRTGKTRQVPVTDSTITVTRTITVHDTAKPPVPPVDTNCVGLTVSPSGATLAAGASTTFKAQCWPGPTSPKVTWTATGGTISTSGAYKAGTVAGSFTVTATLNATKAEAVVVTVTGGTTPPPGPNAMYFNSAEKCEADPNALLCDDFEDGDWYKVNYDKAMSSGGLLQTDGWGGTIYAEPITPAGAAVCGNKGYRSNCAATSGFHAGSVGGRNMADHAFVGNTSVTDAYLRVYFQPQSDYDGGHEKMFDFTYGGSGSAQMIALCYNYFGGETIACIPYLHQDDGIQGAASGWVRSNAGPELTLQRGHWYAFQFHIKLNTPGQYNGTLEWFLDDCTTGCTGSPTLRGRSTAVLFRNAGSESSYGIKGIWIENWANAATVGTMLYDNVRAGKSFIGFAQ